VVATIEQPETVREEVYIVKDGVFRCLEKRGLYPDFILSVMYDPAFTLEGEELEVVVTYPETSRRWFTRAELNFYVEQGALSQL
jgi:hypothetical protein